jgi:hypothetical protein
MRIQTHAVNSIVTKATDGCTYSKISSVIWCELSILPLSASNMSAAEDLCALGVGGQCDLHENNCLESYSMSFLTPESRFI